MQMAYLRGKKRLDIEAMLGIATISTQFTITIFHIPNTNRAISDPKTTAMTTNYFSMLNLINTTLNSEYCAQNFTSFFSMCEPTQRIHCRAQNVALTDRSCICLDSVCCSRSGQHFIYHLPPIFSQSVFFVIIPIGGVSWTLVRC